MQPTAQQQLQTPPKDPPIQAVREIRVKEDETDEKAEPLFPGSTPPDMPESLTEPSIKPKVRKREVAPLSMKLRSRDNDEEDEIPGLVEAMNQFSMPMLEVPMGETIGQVFRPWTFAEIKEVAASLPEVTDGGEEFCKRLKQFCETFRPSLYELGRVLAVRMGVDWKRVQGDLMTGLDIQPNRTELSQAYLTKFDALCLRIKGRYPRQQDPQRIAECKQQPGESASNGAFRLRGGLGGGRAGRGWSAWTNIRNDK
ncbi:uncharacterized protein [Hoplias malabaricus]|uniref:uncharacterized protein n=1 Tax=Hoplias malabaricus TaxID=27720 RepID=UPI0034634022